MKKSKFEIEDLIPEGYEKAMPIGVITAVTGLKNRELREAIANANLRGAKIINLSDGHGYFKPKLPEEQPLLEIYIDQEKSRIKHLLQKIDALNGGEADG